MAEAFVAEINEGDSDHHPFDTWDPILPDPLIRSRTRVDQVDEEEESVGTTAEEATKVPTKQNQPTTVFYGGFQQSEVMDHWGLLDENSFKKKYS